MNDASAASLLFEYFRMYLLSDIPPSKTCGFFRAINIVTSAVGPWRTLRLPLLPSVRFHPSIYIITYVEQIPGLCVVDASAIPEVVAAAPLSYYPHGPHSSKSRIRKPFEQFQCHMSDSKCLMWLFIIHRLIAHITLYLLVIIIML